jgi:hypothetical protein
MPTDSPEASGPRKRKLSAKVITNGDPEVERKRKRLEAKEQHTKPAPTQKHSKTTTKAAAKPAPRPRRPSVEIEEVEDESADHTSVPPHNPQHILEAANGSDDDVDTPAPPRKSTKRPVVTKRRPSVEFEEVYDDEADQHTSVPPRNPRNILEAADGSDDDEEDPVADINKEHEEPEESDEAELGTYLIITSYPELTISM